MEAAFKPEVNDELDTQNFEKFEEVRKFYFVHDIYNRLGGAIIHHYWRLNVYL